MTCRVRSSSLHHSDGTAVAAPDKALPPPRDRDRDRDRDGDGDGGATHGAFRTANFTLFRFAPLHFYEFQVFVVRRADDDRAAGDAEAAEEEVRVGRAMLQLGSSGVERYDARPAVDWLARRDDRPPTWELVAIDHVYDLETASGSIVIDASGWLVW